MQSQWLKISGSGKRQNFGIERRKRWGVHAVSRECVRVCAWWGVGGGGTNRILFAAASAESIPFARCLSTSFLGRLFVHLCKRRPVDGIRLKFGRIDKILPAAAAISSLCARSVTHAQTAETVFSIVRRWTGTCHSLETLEGAPLGHNVPP